MSSYFTGIQQSNAQFVSSYFSSLSSSSAKTSSGLSDMFSVLNNSYKDYALIQTGAYTKLLKAYYAKNSSSEESTATDQVETLKDSETVTSYSADTAEEVAAVKDAAKNLKASADALMQSSLYEKKTNTVVDEVTKEETVTQDYDWDSLYKQVSEFASNYNTLVSKMSDVSSSSLQKNESWLMNVTSSNKSFLNRVGITINENKTISVDEAKFKEADISDIKSLFCGSNSYGGKISYKASNIKNLAENIVQTMNTGGDRTYTSTGSYSMSVSGSLYDSIL